MVSVCHVFTSFLRSKYKLQRIWLMNPNTEEEFGKLFNSMRPAGQGDESKHQKLTANKRFWGGGLRDHLASTAPPKKKTWSCGCFWGCGWQGWETPHPIESMYGIVYLPTWKKLSRRETPNSVKTKCNVYVSTLYVSTLCASTLCVRTMCEHFAHT